MSTSPREHLAETFRLMATLCGKVSSSYTRPPARLWDDPGYFLRHQASIVQSAVETLVAHYVDLRLRHVQPTAVFGCVMKLDLVQNPTRLRWTEGVIETCSVAGVQ